ncbi:MAG: ABC transporter permease, partial [Solirubrobacterales bacterium]|nr:ABC transporter permease [Solirubrobacterales bacterium]MBA3861691.1 ABC transporter permease [Solirubrobacterales bacterium]
MIRLALRGMRERRARTAFTTLAVTLGVALVAGTLILSDTIEASFDRLLAASGENVDVNVVARGQDTFGTPVAMPAQVEQRAEAVEGVEAAAGSFGDLTVAVVDERGDRVGPVTGAPTLAYSTVPERFDPYGYEEGRAPGGEGEIAIGLNAAQDAGLAVGDRVRVLGNGPARPFRVVGLATFGGTGALGGAGFVVLTLPEVQALATELRSITQVDIQAVDGVEPEVLAGRVRAALGDDVVVRTGEEAEAASARDFGEILGYLTIGLLVFGAIALLVGAFVIFNTFTITIAQRTRELGMLRTIGASRRQVLRAVLLEALLIGAAGAVLGLLAGLVLAPGLRALMAAIGLELPATALVVAPSTVVVALILGTVVTLLACLVPALRATRVPPLAALREA